MRPVHGGEIGSYINPTTGESAVTVDFSANISPFDLSDKVKSALEEAGRYVNSTDNAIIADLRDDLAEYSGVASNQVLVTAGTTDAIHLAVRALCRKTALVIEPTNLEYRYALNLHGIEVRNLLLRERKDFKITISEAINALQGIEVLFIANPNSPTGSVWSREDLELIVQEANSRRIFVVIDESHVDWSPANSCYSFIEKGYECIVLRSIGKFFGLPGLRVGYVLGSPSILGSLKAFQVTCPVSPLSAFIARAAVSDKSYPNRIRLEMNKNKERFIQQLDEFAVLKLFSSAANFVLLKLHGSRKTSDFDKRLAEFGITIRDCASYPGLDNHFFRISIKSKQENDYLIEVFNQILPKKVF